MSSMTPPKPDDRAEAARSCLAEVSRTPIDQLPPSAMMRELAQLRRHLAAVLDVIGERAVSRP